MQTLEQNQQKVYIQLMPKDKDNRYSRPAKAGLYNKSLTLAEKGLISIMVGMNPYEPITIAKLSTKCIEYDDTLRSYLNSLESKGLVTKELIKKKGAIKEYHYTLNELHVANLTDRTFTDRLKAKKKQAQNKSIQGLDTVSNVAKSYERKVTTSKNVESIDIKEFSEFSKNIYNNNNNNYYYRNNNFEDENNNVENCVIQISDLKKEKEDLEKIQIIKNYLNNITSVDLPFKLKDVESLQRQSKEFYDGGMSIDDIKTMIDLFPDFVRANKTNNPKKSYSENQSLSFLADALKKNYNYPEWFISLHKKEEVKKEVTNLEQSWKQIIEFWDARGSRIDDCIKNMIKMILESIQDFEYHKVNNLSNDKRMIEFFNTATKKTLSKKSISEFMDLIKEYISKTWLSVDPFQKQINNFNDAGFTLETIKLYIESGVN